MADDSTLLAHLVPRLTIQVENAATDALAYILNRSPGAMGVLNGLLREGGFGIEPIARVETQVAYEDLCRPDMAGYDRSGATPLLVESKFWAPLGEGQAREYLRHLNQPGPAVLLFIAPEGNIPTLWTQIAREMEECCKGLEPIDSPQETMRARVIRPERPERRLMLVSWVALLNRMLPQAGDEGVASDIRQLRGLAQAQDMPSFLPLHAGEISPSLGLRVVWYNQLVDHVVDSRGVPETWMDIQGLKAQPQRYGYGRYFRFVGVEGDLWLGVNHEQWAKSADTPLWLSAPDHTDIAMDEIGRRLGVEVQRQRPWAWVPIRLKLGVEYGRVLEGVVSQLKRIREVLLELRPAAEQPSPS